MNCPACNKKMAKSKAKKHSKTYYKCFCDAKCAFWKQGITIISIEFLTKNWSCSIKLLTNVMFLRKIIDNHIIHKNIVQINHSFIPDFSDISKLDNKISTIYYLQ